MTSIGQRSIGEIASPEASSRPPGRARIALPAIIGIESWERFSFYGMQEIMAYYLYGAVTDGGIGLSLVPGAAGVAIGMGLVAAGSGAVFRARGGTMPACPSRSRPRRSDGVA